MLQSLITGVTYVGVFLHQVDYKVFSYNKKERFKKFNITKVTVDVITFQCCKQEKTNLEVIPMCQRIGRCINWIICSKCWRDPRPEQGNGDQVQDWEDWKINQQRITALACGLTTCEVKGWDWITYLCTILEKFTLSVCMRKSSTGSGNTLLDQRVLSKVRCVRWIRGY